MEPYELLEQEWAKANRLPEVGMVVCSSGTAALHLAFEGLCLPRGSQILIPEFTMIACARAATLAGLRPVFVDCRSDLTMDPEDVEDKLTPLTSAILMVHPYGRMCDRSKIKRIAEESRLFMIEDCAEFHGGPLYEDGDRIADALCWSFYQNKIVSGEEGGAVYFSSQSSAGIARLLRSQGFTESHNFSHIPYGHNYRLANSLAEPIRESVRQFPENVSGRMETAQKLAGLFRFHDPDQKRVHVLYRPEDIPWVFPIEVQGTAIGADGIDSFVRDLNEQGIPARCSFKPMSQQTEYRGHYKHLKAYQASRSIFYLPLSPVIDGQTLDLWATKTVRAVYDRLPSPKTAFG